MYREMKNDKWDQNRGIYTEKAKQIKIQTEIHAAKKQTRSNNKVYNHAG